MNKICRSEPDLSAIAPAISSEVRRRLAAVREFEASPGRKNAERLAQSINLSPAQFYNLVKAWKTLRDPARLAGHSQARTRTISIDNEQAKVIDHAIHVSEGALPNDIVRMAIKKAQQKGVTLPSAEKIKRYVCTRRKAELPNDVRSSGDIIIDHTVLELPVQSDANLMARPLATMVINAPLNTICAIELSLGPPTATKMASVIRSSILTCTDAWTAADFRKVALPQVDDPMLMRLAEILDNAGFSVSHRQLGAYGHGRALEALLGQRSAGIRFRPRLVNAGESRRKMPKRESRVALTLAEAQALAASRLGIKPATAGMSLLKEPRLLKLVDELAAFTSSSCSN